MKTKHNRKKRLQGSRGIALVITLLLLSLFTVMTLAMVIATEGTGLGVALAPPAVTDAETIMLPAVVPVNRSTFWPKTACVVPAGMVKLTLGPPLEN